MIPAHERLIAAVIAAGCLGVLVTAALLAPSAEGHGTHEQLGLPPCGFLSITGEPCMTCGMTTSFTHAANADFGKSFVTQPMGTVGVIATATLFWIALHGAAFGSQALRLTGRLIRPRALWVIGGLWTASWVYKISTWQG